MSNAEILAEYHAKVRSTLANVKQNCGTAEAIAAINVAELQLHLLSAVADMLDSIKEEKK